MLNVQHRGVGHSLLLLNMCMECFDINHLLVFIFVCAGSWWDSCSDEHNCSAS